MALLTLPKSQSRSALRRAGELGKRAEYLAFLLSGDSYAIPISYIAEILKPLPITEVPRAAPEVVGVMSVRGRLVTVVDLRRRFGLAHLPMERKARILLVNMGDDEPIGLLVDEVLQVYRLAETEIEPASVLGGEQPAHIAGIGRPVGQTAPSVGQNGAVLILLDLKPIFGG